MWIHWDRQANRVVEDGINAKRELRENSPQTEEQHCEDKSVKKPTSNGPIYVSSAMDAYPY